MSQNIYRLSVLGAFFLMVSFLGGCAKNKATGRNQLSLISSQELMNYSSEQYNAFLKENKVISGTQASNRVKTVGANIAKAITQYYQQQGHPEILNGFKWEYNLVESKEVNAWCMPGGKIAVYTGLLPVTQNDAALAVVMGHEIAHAIAEHGKERVSGQMLQQLGAVGLSVMVASKPRETQDAFMVAYGVGSTYGAMLPFSRKQELEADQLGLIYCAMAGYDPREAIPFWKRMAAANSASIPEFASTHPATDTRIKQLDKMMPEALAYYQKSNPVGQ